MQAFGTARLVVPQVVVAMTVAGLLAVRACAGTSPPAPMEEAAWREPLRAANAAIAERDVSRAVRAWHEAQGAALRSGSWDALVEVGDASLRIGELAAAREGARAQARSLYLRALFRARDHRSLDGVLRATEAFASLGDADVVEQGLRVAGHIAATQGPAARDRVREATIRLGARRSMAESTDPGL